MEPLISQSLLKVKNKTTIIGWSARGRPLQVRFLNHDHADLRVFVIAGQHGDEHLAREAARRFSRRYSPSTHRQMSVAVLENANPDGSAADVRANAKNFDLNRDHQLLRMPETQAIHDFVRAWQPHVILDVHTFAPRRKKLLSKDMVYHHHVLIDVANNPSLWHVTNAKCMPHFLNDVIEQMNQLGHLCDRYVVLSPLQQFRHSVADVLDARNGLALRYQAFTVLLEGREGKTQEAKERTTEGLCCGIEQTLKWCVRHSERIKAPLPSASQQVSIRNRYESTSQSKSMTFLNALENATRSVDLHLHNFVDNVVSTKQVCLPDAYAVPLSQKGVLSILYRHGFDKTNEWISHAEQYTIRELVPSTIAKRAARSVQVEKRLVSICQRDYAMFPVRQRGGNALAVFLEPESKYGLCRHPECQLTLASGADYPILRVIFDEGNAQD